MDTITTILDFLPIEVIGGIILGFAGVAFVKNLKKFVKKGTTITKELGEAFLATSNALAKVDHAINADGSFKENSIAEIIAAGKEAKLEWEDVIIEVKPKKGKTKILTSGSDEPELPPFPPKK